MFGFRFFAPFIFVLLIISGFFHFLWLPGYVDLEKDTQYQYEQGALTLLGEALIPYMLSSDYAAVHGVISQVLRSHESFEYLELFHKDTTRLYPLAPDKVDIDPDLEIIKHDIIYKGEVVGSLVVRIDINEYIEHEIEEVKEFELLVIGLLLILFIVSAIMQYQWVNTPLKKLAVATRRIAEGDYGAELPEGVSKDLRKFISSFDLMRKKLGERDRKIARQQEIEDTIRDIQTYFISVQDKHLTFKKILDHIIYLTGSQIGMIGEVGYEGDEPHLDIYSISNISWDVESRKMYEQSIDGSMRFSGSGNLFGVVLMTGKIVISDDPKNDPRGGGFPKGHPELKNFLGVPIYSSKSTLMGMVGVADSQQGYNDETIVELEVLWLAIGNLIDAQRKRLALLERENELNKIKQELMSANEKLEDMVRTDGLTGIANRRYFDEVLAQEFNRSIRQSIPLTLIMFDIDYFKAYNDQYGHHEGDQCLIEVTTAAEKVFQRSGELVARYGGEEFAVIVPHSEAKSISYLADKLLHAVCGLEIPHEASAVSEFVTISVGIASMAPNSDDEAQMLVISADRALYQAKRSGRNRVVLAE